MVYTLRKVPKFDRFRRVYACFVEFLWIFSIMTELFLWIFLILIKLFVWIISFCIFAA